MQPYTCALYVHCTDKVARSYIHIYDVTDRQTSHGVTASHYPLLTTLMADVNVLINQLYLLHFASTHYRPDGVIQVERAVQRTILYGVLVF